MNDPINKIIYKVNIQILKLLVAIKKHYAQTTADYIFRKYYGQRFTKCTKFMKVIIIGLLKIAYIKVK